MAGTLNTKIPMSSKEKNSKEDIIKGNVQMGRYLTGGTGLFWLPQFTESSGNDQFLPYELKFHEDIRWIWAVLTKASNEGVSFQIQKHFCKLDRPGFTVISRDDTSTVLAMWSALKDYLAYIEVNNR